MLSAQREVDEARADKTDAFSALTTRVDVIEGGTEVVSRHTLSDGHVMYEDTMVQVLWYTADAQPSFKVKTAASGSVHASANVCSLYQHAGKSDSTAGPLVVGTRYYFGGGTGLTTKNSSFSMELAGTWARSYHGIFTLALSAGGDLAPAYCFEITLARVGSSDVKAICRTKKLP